MYYFFYLSLHHNNKQIEIMEEIIKLVKGELLTYSEIEYSDLSPKTVLEYARTNKVSDETLSEELYEICDSVHSSCNNECPVYKLNGSSVPDTAKDFKVNRGCDCFKRGSKMLEFIRKSI